jgi:hypothetical protein
MNFTFLWGPPKNGVKSREVQNLGSNVLMGIWSAQKVCKIAENAKCRSLKWGVYCICMTLAFQASPFMLCI